MSENNRKQPDNHSVPCIRGRLLQDGCLFHLQTCRDDIRAAFTGEEARWLAQAFPLILQQMVTMADPGSPEAQMPHVFHHNGLTCESEPGPQGAVCLMIYPTSVELTPSEESVNDEDHNHST
ncbi:type IV toxin-antitoxin system YeeU family antitoxin [Salmonella enterica subsp. enterica serovar Wedding]|nr:type IV toxin-antitoxin system YeeU family antitoxin [Salmonella enterica subsp. enterica serovar Wedding]